MTTQVWPDETFAAGATAYGTTPRRWLRVLPWTTQPEAVTGQSLRVTLGTLHDRRQTGGEGSAAAVADDGTPDRIACWVERSQYLLAGEVMLNPRFVATPAPTQDSWRGVALLARVSGGSLTQPGGDYELEGHTGVSCYALVEAKQAAGVRRLSLLKVSSGTPTLLQQVQVANIDPDVAANQLEDARRLRLVVDDNAGQARLNAYRLVRDANGRLVEVDAFGATIVDGTGLPAGRWGFGMQVERTESGTPDVESAMLADLFRLRSADGSTVFVRDIFARAVRAASRIVVGTGAAGGRSLLQAWGGDAEGAAPPDEFRGHVREGSGVARLGVSPVGLGFAAQAPGWYPWQHPSPGPDRRRVVVCTFTGGGAAGIDREFGVFVRAGFVPKSSGAILLQASASLGGADRDDRRTGYLVALVFEALGDPVWRIEIRHFDGSSLPSYVSTLLASADLDGAGLALGTAIELDVEVRNESAQGTTAPSLRVLVDDEEPEWEIPVTLQGVAAIDGRVYDLRSAASLEGPADGLYLRAGAYHSGGLVDVDSWTTAAPAVDPVQDYPSVALPAETDGAVGTLTVPPTWPVRETPDHAVVRHDHDDGTLTIHRLQPRGRRRWTVVASGATLAELDALRTFWREHRGPTIPFGWTTRQGEAVTVRFVGPQLATRATSVRTEGGVRLGAGDVTFEIEEALDGSVWNGGAP